MEKSELYNIIEAVLFASGEPLEFREFSSLFMKTDDETKKLLNDFKYDYNQKNCGIEAVIADATIQLLTKSEYFDYIKTVLKSGTRQNRSLSKPALEVLAIIAYNQPVTRSYVEQVRGVDSSYLIGNLYEKDFITEAGKLDVPGRPNLYATTTKFLSLFGLESLSELPSIEKFNELYENFPEI